MAKKKTNKKTEITEVTDTTVQSATYITGTVKGNKGQTLDINLNGVEQKLILQKFKTGIYSYESEDKKVILHVTK